MKERNVIRRALRGAVLLFPLVWLAHFESVAKVKEVRPVPIWSLDSRTLGLNHYTGKDLDPFDKEIMRTHDISILNSQDFDFKLTFVSDDTLAIYQTRGPNGELRVEEPLFMEAVFLDASSGAMKHRQKWPVRKRHREFDVDDTEGRIIPVDGGRFVVHADNKLMLYSPDFKLLKERKLEGDIKEWWAVKTPPGGKRLFLWSHKNHGGFLIAWMDLETPSNRVGVPMPRPELSDREAVFLPTETGFYVYQGDTLVPYPATGAATLSCNPPDCGKETIFARPMTGGQVVFMSKSGVVIYARDGRATWSREILGVRVSRDVERSLDGNTFVVQLSSEKGEFDGVRLSKKATYFVYDVASLKRTLLVRVPSSLVFALAPNGSMLGVFYGTTIQVFKTDRP
ncbi:MAG: hypothetical protein GZ088_08280 [Acidipila sp.]|nr:hypothetical protein [Acidipila sp.]